MENNKYKKKWERPKITIVAVAESKENVLVASKPNIDPIGPPPGPPPR